MSMIIDVLPEEATLLALEPEELALPVLECLCRAEAKPDPGLRHRSNFVGAVKRDYSANRDVHRAIVEAWTWLEREGLIAPDPEHSGEWVFVTRRGKKLRADGNVARFRAASLLPAEILDPSLIAKIRPPLMRGAFDSAVFEAFKELEIRVRTAAGLGADDLGVNLMRAAFHPDRGKLTDPSQTGGEREGVQQLFAGAIATFKNPSSHRDVRFSDVREATEIIAFADLLLRIVDRRSSTSAPPAPSPSA